MGRSGSPRAAVAAYLPPARAFTRLAKRDTLRALVFLWSTPRVTPREDSDSAWRRAAAALPASPDAMASSTARQKVRIRERRALFTAVRRASRRIAFLADEVLAIGSGYSEFETKAGLITPGAGRVNQRAVGETT